MKTFHIFIFCIITAGAFGQSATSQYKHVKENIKNSTTPTQTEYDKSFAVTNDSASTHQTLTQTDSIQNTDSTMRDTIFKLDRKKIICSIKDIRGYYVAYTTTQDSSLQKIERKQVQYIQYSDGRKEDFNRGAVEVIESNTWESILLTDKPADVSGLYAVGDIEAQSPPESNNARAAKADATIRIKKQAAAMKGIIVLVTKRESKGGYDEIPSYYIKGTVYTNKPPKKSDADPAQQTQ